MILGRGTMASGAAAAPLPSLDITHLLLQGVHASTPGQRARGKRRLKSEAAAAAPAGQQRTAGELLQQRIRQLQATLQATAASDGRALLDAAKAASSPFVNELQPPRARVAERAWQLSQVEAANYGL